MLFDEKENFAVNKNSYVFGEHMPFIPIRSPFKNNYD